MKRWIPWLGLSLLILCGSWGGGMIATSWLVELNQNGVLYLGGADPGSVDSTDWRIRDNGSDSLVIERYNGTSWIVMHGADTNGPLTEHGELYAYGNATATTIAAADSYHTVTILDSSASLIGFTAEGDSALVADADIQGSVFVSWSLSASAAAANKEFHVVVFVNDTEINSTEQSINITVTAARSISGSGIIDSISSGDKITLRIENVTDDSNITISYGGFTLVKI